MRRRKYKKREIDRQRGGKLTDKERGKKRSEELKV